MTEWAGPPDYTSTSRAAKSLVSQTAAEQLLQLGNELAKVIKGINRGKKGNSQGKREREVCGAETKTAVSSCGSRGGSRSKGRRQAAAASSLCSAGDWLAALPHLGGGCDCQRPPELATGGASFLQLLGC